MNGQNQIYRCKAPCTDNAWTRINGVLKQIDVGKGYVYGTAPDNRIYRCRLPCDTGAWETIAGALNVITGP